MDHEFSRSNPDASSGVSSLVFLHPKPATSSADTTAVPAAKKRWGLAPAAGGHLPSSR